MTCCDVGGPYDGAHPPPMHYDLTVLNGGSQLPDDLGGIGTLYW